MPTGEIISKNKGDSITIKIIVDSSITLANINELVVYLGDKLSAKKSVSGQLTQVGSTFTWKIPSSDTLYLSGINAVTVSLDYDGYGNRKTFQETAPKIQFLSNNNVFSDESVSDNIVDLTINLNFESETLTVSETLLNVFFNMSLPRAILVAGINRGDNIRHGLGSDVYGIFIGENNEQKVGYSLTPVDMFNATVNMPFFDDLLGSFTGTILVIPITNYLPAKVSIFKLPDDIASLQAGSVITHGLDGDVFLEYIEGGQIRVGYYGDTNTGTTITLRTPQTEDNNTTIITGYIRCTKLN